MNYGAIEESWEPEVVFLREEHTNVMASAKWSGLKMYI